MKSSEVKREFDKASFLAELFTFNVQYTMLSDYADTTVMQTPEAMIRGRFSSRYNRQISEEFLLNFRTNNNSLGFSMGVGRFFTHDAMEAEAHKDLSEIKEGSTKLSSPKKIKSALGDVIRSRRSVRDFKGNNIPFDDFSSLLYYADGISGKLRGFDMKGQPHDLTLRTAASGGGLFPIILYIVVWHVEGLKKGIYVYQPYSNTILFKKSVTTENLRSLAAFGGQIDPEKSAFSVVYVYNYYMNTRKYGDGALAYALIEAGEISANLQLSATGLGYGCCDLGGYQKQYIEDLLDLDGHTKQVIHFTIVGEENG